MAFRAGSVAMAAHNLPLAHTEFAKVVRLMPNIATGHSAFGAVLLAEGKVQAAVTELEQAHRLDPADEFAGVNLAKAFVGVHRYAEALTLFRSLSAPLAPDSWRAYATALAETNDLPGGTTQLEKAVAAYPQNSLLEDALGTVLAQARQYAEAKPHFEQAIAADPSSASAFMHLGALLLTQQDQLGGIAALTSASRLAPDDQNVLLQLGQAQVAARQDLAALETLRKAHTIAAASTDIAYALALALQNAGDSAQALPLFAVAAAARPDDVERHTNYALALVQTGDAVKAVQVYERAIKLDSNDAVLREDLGVAYLQRNLLDLAIEQFRAGLALSEADRSQNAALHYDLGLALKLKDKLPESIAEFKLAESIDPQLPDAPYTLAVLQMQLGQFAEASNEMEKALAMQPENGEGWALLGSIYNQMDRPERAAPALKRAIELLPDQPGPRITLSSVLAKGGDHASAKAERSKAAELSRLAVSRQKSRFSLGTGVALLKSGKVEEAIAQLHTAIEADPGDPEPHRVIADAFARQGRAADAALERQKAEALEAPGKSATKKLTATLPF